MATPTSATTTPKPAGQSKPPKALMMVMNPVLSALLRSPFHSRLSSGLMLLTFTGRKSGKQYTTPVAYHRVGPMLRVFTDSPWYKNLRGGAPVTMLLQGQQRRGQATVVDDPEVVYQVVHDFLREKGADHARELGLMSLDRTRPPTEAELHAVLVGRVIVEIRPEGAGA